MIRLQGPSQRHLSVPLRSILFRSVPLITIKRWMRAVLPKRVICLKVSLLVPLLSVPFRREPVCTCCHVAFGTSTFFSMFNMSLPSVAFLLFRSVQFRSVPFVLNLFLPKCWKEVMFTLFFSQKTISVRLCKHRGSKNLFSPFNRCQNTQLSFTPFHYRIEVLFRCI